VAGWVEAADVVRRQPGTVLGRAGRVHINLEDYQVSVGGETHTIVRGTVAL
jgi:predicted PhzF superfamily epimerase YddE/YHI9